MADPAPPALLPPPPEAGPGGRQGAARRAALLAGLDDDQLAAVTIEAAPLAILAGAGAGKTRVLTRRIAYRVASDTARAEHVVVVTFTRRAAGELRERLGALGLHRSVTAGTFHALAWGLLRQWWTDRGRPSSELLPRPLSVLGPILQSGRRSGDPQVHAASVAAEISWAKARLVGPDGYEAAARAAGRRPGLPLPGVATLYERYEEAKRKRRVVDFDDVLWRCLGVLESDEAFAAAVRWRWRHLFADEFQDVNPLQFRLLDAWRGGRPDLCVVGDPHQAIYGWNGADPSLLADVARHLPGTTVVRLRANHRTTPEILSVAEALLPAAGGRAPVTQIPSAGSGPVPAVHACRDEAHEAALIARLLVDRRGPGSPWRSMAVLARTHAQLVPIRAGLAAARVPHRVRGAAGLLDHPAVAGWLAEARTAGTLAEALADLNDRLAADEEAAVAEAPDRTPDEVRAAAAAAADPLVAVAAVAADHLRVDPAASVGGFTAWLAATGDDQLGPAPDAVELATFHAAKGLEWATVVVAGFEDGFVPAAAATRAAARDEEARLAYVALTRAKRELHVTWAASRVVGARERAVRSPSPWLGDVTAAVERLEPPRRPGRGEGPALAGAQTGTGPRGPCPHDAPDVARGAGTGGGGATSGHRRRRRPAGPRAPAAGNARGAAPRARSGGVRGAAPRRRTAGGAGRARHRGPLLS
jgi:DNA helicase II / ATP-dependent DNA helicase PcrA